MVAYVSLVSPASMLGGAGRGQVPFDVGDAGDERNIGQVNDTEGEVEFGLIGRG